MAVGDPKVLLMYVRSRPRGTRGLYQYIEPSILGRIASMLVPGAGAALSAKEATIDRSEAEEAELAVDEAQCVRLVLDLARKSGRSVHVVDISHQDLPADVIEKRLDSPDGLPVLLRSDGARLAGSASFTPRAVRRFLVRA